MDFVQKTDDECVRNIFCFSSRLMNCESMEYVLGEDGKVRDEDGQEVKAKLIDDDLGNSYLSMRNAQGVRKLIPISHLMAYFLRLCDTGGAIEDDSGFDQNDVAQMNWYTIDELEEEEEVEILSK